MLNAFNSTENSLLPILKLTDTFSVLLFSIDGSNTKNTSSFDKDRLKSELSVTFSTVKVPLDLTNSIVFPSLKKPCGVTYFFSDSNKPVTGKGIFFVSSLNLIFEKTFSSSINSGLSIKVNVGILGMEVGIVISEIEAFFRHLDCRLEQLLRYKLSLILNLLLLLNHP